GELDCRRWWRPQSDLAADAHRAAYAGARGIGACRRLVDRFTRGAGLRLPRRAQPAWSTDHVSDHNGSAAAADGWRAGAAVSCASLRATAKQSRSLLCFASWNASSLALLAMTASFKP